jgi:hypothetical protein
MSLTTSFSSGGDDDFTAGIGALVTTTSQLIAIVPNQRNIGGFIADVTIEEQHVDRLRITEHPVEQGAAITDHAYKMPAQVTIRAGWSNSAPAALGDPQYIQGIYSSFLTLQASRQLFDIFTGKRSYTNMLIETLIETTDKEHENAMVLVVECKEVIIATTQTTSVGSSANMANPSSNAATQNQGTVSAVSNPSTYNASAAPLGLLY